MNEFLGKIALITGAGRGLGRQIAFGFSSLGAVVAANDINPINLDETINQILQAGGIARAYVFDVAKRMPIEGMIAQVLEHFGRIDILINHASITPDASILDMDEWEYHRTMDVNLGGPFFCMQQAGRLMREQGGGAIVNIVSSIVDGQESKGCAAYWASQAGMLSLTRAAAHEFSKYNIRVNAVSSGLAEEELFIPLRVNNVTLQRSLESYPEARLGGHPSLVSLVLYLCSDVASSLSGQLVSVELGD